MDSPMVSTGVADLNLTSKAGKAIVLHHKVAILASFIELVPAMPVLTPSLSVMSTVGVSDLVSDPLFLFFFKITIISISGSFNPSILLI